MKVISRHSGARSGSVKISFADFIRNAKADEKKRVYGVVLAEATQSQNELMASMMAQRQA